MNRTLEKVSVLLSFVLAASAAIAQKVYTFDKPDLINVRLERISRPLIDLPEQPVDPRAPMVVRETESFFHHGIKPNPAALPQGEDPVLQKFNVRQERTALATTMSVLSNWAGLSASVSPSDNTLAVGPNHVVQMTNNSSSTYIRVWNKSGTVLVANKLVNSFSGINDYGDPNIIYDQAADRFVFVLLYSKSAKKLEVCVSQTNDPTGAWYVYSFTTSAFPDYPKLAVWGNSYLITTNQSTPSIYALNRTSMLAGSGTGTAQVFTMSRFPSIGFQAASPVTQTGSTLPPANSPALLMRVADDAWGTGVGPDHLETFLLNINWTTPASSTISGPININTAAYNSSLCGFGSSSCIPQPGSTTKLDPLSDILMDKVQYRNFGTYEAIVCSHVCNADGLGKAGVRWYELRKNTAGSWYIYQQSTYSVSSDHRFMSSISINPQGKIALGYNVSSSTRYPSLALTGRDSCDALNTLTVPEQFVAVGTASNSNSRYGDYNAMVCDPVDGSFWMTSQYNPSASWATKVVHFNFTDCAVPAFKLPETGLMSEELLLVPNPADNEVKVKFPSQPGVRAVATVFDLSGRRVLEREAVVGSEQGEILLDITELEEAAYFIHVEAPGFSATQRLLIQR